MLSEFIYLEDLKLDLWYIIEIFSENFIEDPSFLNQLFRISNLEITLQGNQLRSSGI